MKKLVLMIGALGLFAATSCKKTDVVATDSTTDTLGVMEMVDNDSLPITNDPTVNAVNDAAENAKESTENAVKDGAQSVKEGANEATDGDGNVAK